MAICDVFPFSNELDLLEIRLNVLDEHVDYFVLSEAAVTFSGHSKPLYFDENRDRFSKFESRIIHHVVEDRPAASTFERDRDQKDDILRTLGTVCAPTDLILFSDVDEIPNPNRLPEAIAVAEDGRMAHFAQRLFYYFLNLEETSGRLLSITGDYPGLRHPQWIGSRLASYEMVSGTTMTDLRDPRHKSSGTRISDGGWHFSYCGSPSESITVEERVRQKVRDFAHQELVNERMLRKLSGRLNDRKDIFGRRGTKFRRAVLDDSFPDYVTKNLDQYSYLVMP